LIEIDKGERIEKERTIKIRIEFKYKNHPCQCKITILDCGYPAFIAYFAMAHPDLSNMVIAPLSTSHCGHESTRLFPSKEDKG